ncbi:methenyltetrahydrofolate cyclohydrolase [Candidatus Magnetobacterium bavaricum]|uniref:Bifunctional protein FolD n=1 Tax=Candidatus Magnetobacterium bavaricum TaxID=29290 RepID=A0A0F3GIQ7_9BACT|nr:methenyltetrahydrofolate cyclohydrolase [Candidatus Magnetobacterium bavaricum]
MAGQLMAGQVMEGHRLAGEIRGRVKQRVDSLKDAGIEVGLGLMIVGDNPASVQYLQATVNVAKSVHINTYQYRMPASVSLNEILNTIADINRDERINGLLVLFPLHSRVNPRRVVNAILPEKDIDGLGSVSVGRLAAEESTFQIFAHDPSRAAREKQFLPQHTDYLPCMPSGFLPCTPFGVIRLLEFYGVQLRGKNAVVIGKSLAVGKPLAMMLLAKEATVSVCHKGTADLNAYLRNADIVCSATGVSGLIRGDMIKAGAVVVDIGINVLKDGRIVGDVAFEEVLQRASLVTPVPGGVGPVTIATLLENTTRSAQSNALLNSPLLIAP